MTLCFLFISSGRHNDFCLSYWYCFWLNFDIWDKERKKHILGFFFFNFGCGFTRGQFWLSGIVIACMCPCVRQSWACLHDNSSQVQARITKFGPKMQNIWLKFPIVFRTDWAMHSMSNFTFLKNSVYLHRFCIFEIFVRHACRTVPHPTWLRTHSPTSTSSPTGSCHRLWNCLAVYLGETIGVQLASTRRLALYFTSCCRFSTYCTHLTCQNFICQHSTIVETAVKQCPLAFILFNCRCWESLASHRTALFLAP